MSRDRLQLEAPAKINLSLLVTGRRDDGYHLLDSLIVFASVHDKIEIRPGNGLSLAIDGKFGRDLAAEDDNLILRAARALAGECGIAANAALRLEKNLPVSSGIGGGSADAAAALAGLNNFWGAGLDAPALARIGLTLGADVPVCLFGRPARVTGIGEIIEPAGPLPPAGLLLVNPGLAVSTPAVFKERRGEFSAGASRVAGLPGFVAGLAAVLAGLRNDLEMAATTLCPEIAIVLDAIRQQEGCHIARLSGSGATCFGLFDDADAAARAAGKIGSEHRGWWIEPGVIRG